MHVLAMHNASGPAMRVYLSSLGGMLVVSCLVITKVRAAVNKYVSIMLASHA